MLFGCLFVNSCPSGNGPFARSESRRLAYLPCCSVAVEKWSEKNRTRSRSFPEKRSAAKRLGAVKKQPILFFIHFFTAPYAVHEPEKYWLFLHDGSPLAACQAKWSRKDVRSAFSSSSCLARKRNCSFPDGHYFTGYFLNVTFSCQGEYRMFPDGGAAPGPEHAHPE
jgi:hypothetical protein